MIDRTRREFEDSARREFEDIAPSGDFARNPYHSLEVVPMTKKEALGYIERMYGYAARFGRYVVSLGFAAGDELLGVAVVVAPIGITDDGWTAMVHCYTMDDTMIMPMEVATWNAVYGLGYRRLETVDMVVQVAPDYDRERRKPQVEPARRKRRGVEWQGAMGGWK